MGAWLGLRLSWGAAAWWLSAAAGAGLVAAASARRRGRPRLRAALVGLLLVVAALAGLRVVLLEGGVLWQLAVRGGAGTIEATVVGEPRPASRGWWTLVRVTRVGGAASREGALLRGRREIAGLVVGSRWRGTVTARPLGRDGFGGWLRGRHTAVEITPRTWHRVAPPGPVLGAVEALRGRVRGTAAAHLPSPAAGLAAALVTGDTRLVPEDLDDAMRETGLSHLTAVSGSNVAIVVAGVLGVAGILGLGARGRRRLVAATLAGFALLTRLEPSVLRATTMAALVLLGRLRGMPARPAESLAGAVLLLVVLDPMLAASPGLLLSASATAGVLVVAPLVARRLRRLPGRAARIVAVTVGAQVAVAPVLLGLGGGLPVAAVPANLVAVPAAAVASAAAALGALVAVVSPTAGGLVFRLAGPPLAVVRWTAVTLRGVGGEIGWGEPTLLVGLGAGGLWLLVRPGSRAARASAALAVVGTLLVVLPVLVVPGPGDRLTVTAIDVGQGDAVLVRAPGATVLVDGGGDGRAARWLAARGVRHLDLVVVSHPHADHVGGLPAVLRRTRVGALWYRPVGGSPAAVSRMLAAVGDRVPVHRPIAGQRAAVAGLVLEVLSPSAGRPYAGSDSEVNDTSIVLRVSWRGRRVLLTGDVEHAAQGDLLRVPARLTAGVLKVPHHGAATSDPRLFAAVAAPVAVISVGTDNEYGHPHPATLEALRRVGSRVHRTDREGTVHLVVPPTGPELRSPGVRRPAAPAVVREGLSGVPPGPGATGATPTGTAPRAVRAPTAGRRLTRARAPPGVDRVTPCRTRSSC